MNTDIIYGALMMLTMPAITVIAVIINGSEVRKERAQAAAIKEAEEARQILAENNLQKLIFKTACGLVDGGYGVKETCQLFELTSKQKLLLAFRARDMEKQQVCAV